MHVAKQKAFLNVKDVQKYFVSIILEIIDKKLTDQLRQSREENDFVETDIRYWNEELTHLTKELANPLGITLQPESESLVRKISVKLSNGKFTSY